MEHPKSKAPAVRIRQGLRIVNVSGSQNTNSKRGRGEEFLFACPCCGAPPLNEEHKPLCSPCFHFNEYSRLAAQARDHLRAYLAAGVSA